MSKINELFGQDLNVINIGLELIEEDLKKQDVPVTQLKWHRLVVVILKSSMHWIA